MSDPEYVYEDGQYFFDEAELLEHREKKKNGKI